MENLHIILFIDRNYNWEQRIKEESLKEEVILFVALEDREAVKISPFIMDNTCSYSMLGNANPYLNLMFWSKIRYKKEEDED